MSRQASARCFTFDDAQNWDTIDLFWDPEWSRRWNMIQMISFHRLINYRSISVPTITIVQTPNYATFCISLHNGFLNSSQGIYTRSMYLKHIYFVVRQCDGRHDAVRWPQPQPQPQIPPSAMVMGSINIGRIAAALRVGMVWDPWTLRKLQFWWITCWSTHPHYHGSISISLQTMVDDKTNA